MSKRIIIAFMVVASALLASCTKEDLSECNPGVQLKFSYLLNNQGINLFGDEVDQITVLAFDATGHYYATFSDGGNHLTNDYVMTLPLPVGKYTLISWGGDMAHYNTVAITDQDAGVSEALVKGVTTMEQFRIMLKNQVYSEVLSLYHGQTCRVESKVAESSEVYNIDLLKNSKKISVRLKGLNNLPQMAQSKTQTSMFDMGITAHNGIYNHENNIPSHSKAIQYKPHTTTEHDNESFYDISTLRLVIGQESILSVNSSATGDKIFSYDIVALIMESPDFESQLDLDRNFSYEFDFNVNPDLSVSITINGWLITNAIPEL